MTTLLLVIAILALAGAMLLKAWQIPDSITKPIELHHHPSSVTLKDLGVTVEKLHSTVVLYIADQLSRVFNCADGEAPTVLPLRPSYRKFLDRQQLEQSILSSPLTAEVKKALTLTHHFASPAGCSFQKPRWSAEGCAADLPATSRSDLQPCPASRWS